MDLLIALQSGPIDNDDVTMSYMLQVGPLEQPIHDKNEMKWHQNGMVEEGPSSAS